MKKKIALLLATVMTLSASPLNIFAASDNRLSRDTVSIPKETLLYEETIPDNQLANSNQGLSGTQTAPGGTIENYARGMDLIMDLKDEATSGSSFRIQLENGEWCFDSRSDGLTGDIDFRAYNVSTPRIKEVTGQAFTYKYERAGDATYLLRISPFDRSSAVVTLMGDGGSAGTISPKEIRVPMLVYVEDEGVEVIAKITDNNSPVTRGSYLIATSAEGTTITSAKSVKTGREAIALDTIIIKETKSGSLNAKGGVELLAPSGYFFRDKFSTTSPITVAAETGLGSLRDWGWEWTDTNDHTSVALFFNMESNSKNKISGAITIAGLEIEPLDSKNIYFDEELKMDIYNYEGVNDKWIKSGSKSAQYSPTGVTNTQLETKLNVKEEAFTVAKAVDWGVTLTAKDAKTLISGRSANDSTNDEHKAAKVTFEETESGSWLASRTTTFRVPEGVKIIGVTFDTIDNITGLLSSGGKTLKRDMTTSGANETKLTDGDVTISDNEMTLKNVTTTTGKRAKLEFTLFLSIDPNFEGDVTLEALGSAMTDEINNVLIAEAVPPIIVQSTSKDVQIGYQRYAVSDITISETQAGAIQNKGELYIKIDDYSTNRDLYFAQLNKDNWEITEGDIALTLVNTKDGTITFNVDRSSRKASVIKLTGLEIRIDRTVPWGSYDLIVYGDPVYQNYTNDADNTLVRKLGTFGSYEHGFALPNYINVVTEGSNVSLTNNVRITTGSNAIVVNGETQYMDTEAMIDPESHSMLVPFRSVANALGINDKDIYWDDATKTVTLISTSNNRTVKLTANSDTMEINGAKQTMITNGYTVKARIVNERMLVPFRYVGIGLGIAENKVAWNESTSTAEYNPVTNDQFAIVQQVK